MCFFIFFLPRSSLHLSFSLFSSLSLSINSGVIWHFYYSALRIVYANGRNKQTNKSNDSQNLSRRFISWSISSVEEIILSARTPELQARERRGGTKFIYIFRDIILFPSSVSEFTPCWLARHIHLWFPQHCRCMPANGRETSCINKRDNATDVHDDPERIALHRKDTHVPFPFVTRGTLRYVLPRHTCCRVVIFVSLWHVLLLLLDSSKVVFCLRHSSMHSDQASPFPSIQPFFNAFAKILECGFSNWFA